MNIYKKENILETIESYFHFTVDNNYLYVIKDENLSNIHRVDEKYKSMLSAFKIGIVTNPGWICRFMTTKAKRNWHNIAVNVTEVMEYEERFDWFKTLYDNKEFISDGGPQYLSVILEAFRCFITGDKFNLQETEEDLNRLKEKLNQDNPLLAWLSEFAFKHCDPGVKLGYIMLDFRLMVIQAGFVMVFMMEEMELGDCEFEDVLIEEPEGKIHLYKRGDNFFIRTHLRGLIKGLTIFKDWAEKHREVWENIDWD